MPYNMVNEDWTDLIAGLVRTGWLEEGKTVDTDNIDKTIIDKQKLHGLLIDGWAGPVTGRSLVAPRICGLPDYLPMVSTENRFIDHKIKWNLENTFSGAGHDEVKAIFEEAWLAWERVCGILPSYDSNAAVVRSHFGRIDRRGGTLAYSELAPLNGRKFLEQRYDTRELWYLDFHTPPPSYKIDLLAVATHEDGHALGMPHIGGNTGDLMNPMYDPSIRTPQEGDIKMGTDRYGEPISGETPNVDRVKVQVRVGDMSYAGTIPKQ